MSSMRYAKLLLRAVQKAPQIRCCLRGSPRNGRSVMLRTLNDSEFLSSVSKRWATATLIHHGVPQVSSASNFHTSPKLSTVASPDISDKTGSSEASTAIESTSAATGEDASEPVQRVDTPSDEKGRLGLSEIDVVVWGFRV